MMVGGGCVVAAHSRDRVIIWLFVHHPMAIYGFL